MQAMIDAFIESLAVEKGYSINTCRAYRTDVTEFVNFSKRSCGDGAQKADSDGSVHFKTLDKLNFRAYLGYLHGKNQKTTIARKLSAIRMFFRSSALAISP